MARERTRSLDVPGLPANASRALVDLVAAFTDEPLRCATAAALAFDISAPVEVAQSALRVLDDIGVLERLAVPGESAPAYRLRAASTFLEVLDRLSSAYAGIDGLSEVSPAGESAMRARIAALEAKNALLNGRADELAFLFDSAATIGSSLDAGDVANAVLDAVPVATAGRVGSWFLLLRDGNALALHGGATLDRSAAAAFVETHRARIERSLRTGEIVSVPPSSLAVPMPAGPAEPAIGSIAVLDLGAEGRNVAVIRRLNRLAKIAGRSFANARLFAQSLEVGMTDDLTQLHNRRYLDRRLGDELRRVRRLGERVALLLFDLDFFKSVNDEHGHPEGDRVLRAVAETIAAAVRDIDVVTRWGGEEFAVVLPGTEGAGASAVAERIRAAIEGMGYRTRSGEPIHLTISCGVAWAAPHIHTPAQFVAEADRSLLEAKRLGRNRTISMESA
jgi:diguanylate cyclase (GGDEF)-like protein